MCGRYSLALRPSQVRQMLAEDDVAVDEAPDDDGDDAPRQSYNFAPGYHGIVYRADVPDWGAGPARSHEHGHGHGHGRSSKAKKAGPKGGEEVEAEAEGEAEDAETTQQQQQQYEDEQQEQQPPRYKLQSMKWGLVPFWTKRNPEYGAMLKTINCRDDSLSSGGGMWSTMKARKRCVVVAQGFYEWLKPGGPGSTSRGDKVPHFVRRKDGRLMCFAGLWDCVRFEDEDGEGKGKGREKGKGEEGEGESRGGGGGSRKLYTYTIITTSSNKQLRFLHDRMPVILDQKADGGAALRTWLDPARHEWSSELQALLEPYEGELEVYPVTREVGKVGNDSPSFIVPVASKENKGNIANFFAKGAEKKKKKEDEEEKRVKEESESEAEVEEAGEEKVKGEDTGEGSSNKVKKEASVDDTKETGVHSGDDDSRGKRGRGGRGQAAKRKASSSPPFREVLPRAKKASGVASSPVKSPSPKKEKPHGRAKISATSNTGIAKSPVKAKGKGDGSQKITRFFGK